MPSKNRIKIYAPDSYYHIYNRGVEKRDIFLDKEDYAVFLNLLKRYLTSLDILAGSDLANSKIKIRIKKSFKEEISLLTFCLMPNHFHLLIHQKPERSITDFMRALVTSYSMYFNKKYDRVGSLFQDRFKAVIITTDEYLLHVSRYIHLNPIAHFAGSDPAKLLSYPYSSYPFYLGNKHAAWIEINTILSYFTSQYKSASTLTYQQFVEEYYKDKPVLEIPERLMLE